MDMHATSRAAALHNARGEEPASYFAYGDHSGTIIAHIALMILGWCFVLPAAVMFSIARSRLALPSQFLFLILNAVGLLLGIIYNNQTPDLYENNAHHKIGWIITFVVGAQFILALILTYAGRGESFQTRSVDRGSFLPLATDEHESLYPNREIHGYRLSRDSDQGTESASSSPSREDGFEKPGELYTKPSRFQAWLYSSKAHQFLSNHVPRITTPRALRILNTISCVVDRIILPFGFVAIATGGLTYGGIFRGDEIFNGLAHFIRGGIFFWYGILTLGRFTGAWADLGWAWNKKPPARIVGWKSRFPSCEFVESFLIFLYGITNVFLEHLAGWGGEWTARDLEHVAITIMFFGGGLVGMLVESRAIREGLNSTLFEAPTYESELDEEDWRPPKSQAVSLNPMPALIILLLGMIMGGHHQDSMTSTMVHKQWGNLLAGAALARGLTYVVLFLRPPTSYLPYRPPTELVAGFCLISGGLIFMLSASDVIIAMEYYEVHAMFIFTVVMGLTAFIMALVVVAIAIKSWAVRRERSRKERA
ncbi:hypothetical protein BJY04DRAFT_43411 [Aspergillus karnatakaensis]|uniref:Ytp1 family protein n=1 Tax=Aspergillus karnatakaensis TaxID=1810916 RepID=UPI003CCD8B48